MTAPIADTAQENWTSRLSFIMASVGFAVGLGNIWRFPYIVGESGGSAFIFVYLFFAFAIGVPLVMSEWAIGRRGIGASSASGSIRRVARDSGISENWGKVGTMAVLAAFMLLITYSVIAGWTIDYFLQAIRGTFVNIDADRSQAAYTGLLASPLRLGFWHTIVVIVTVFINARGIHAGIERAVNILMPALFFSILLMVAYAWVIGDMGAAARFLLTPDFSRVNGEVLLLALGQAFFSIGIAMAVMITYGSYLSRETSISQNACIVVGADTLVAFFAGFAIFPLVFAHGLPPDAGPGLVFQTLPIAFGDLPGGQFFSSVFFFLLIAAALTSCIGVFAPIQAWTQEAFSCSRGKAALIAGTALWLFGFISVLSFNVIKDVFPLSFIPGFESRTFFDSIDFVMANILLPVGAFLTAVFAGWRVSSDLLREEMGLSNGFGFKLWQFLMRFVVPIAIAIIFISSVSG
ncbi:MAG: sodium-dependent transporter [Woeseia sp.]|nr:sodium-dependent transporter [Woeseia sp.]MBT8096695.1 sodium-dependent transporter [Woeseia sp.]NNE62044.1 sodium-dependent transporter [Woeseia sp.]NNL54096.1 sodium-dependent transporter [Woeseia sp.]